MSRWILCLAAALPLAACHDPSNGAGKRDHIAITGSSTVYPFTSLVAQRFAASQAGDKPPQVESTGTVAGIKQFCAGVGAAFPDIVDASRRMKRSELAECSASGVKAVMEIEVGIDGIAFAQSQAAKPLNLSAVDVYKALAANPNGQPNTSKTWKDVDGNLPATPIKVYGPSPTGGTRDALADLIMSRGCEAVYPATLDMKETNVAGYDKACHAIRADSAYINAGENPTATVAKLEADPDAIGIFGFSYLQANAGKLRGIPLGGSEPTAAAIAGDSYLGARPLYLYVKRAHLSAVKGMRGFLDTYESMWGPNGPLVQHGLIAAPPAVLARSAAVIKNRHILAPHDLN